MVADDRPEHHPMETSLATTADRFQAVIEKSWDAIALLEAEGKVGYVSPSTTRILGYVPDQIVGRNLFDFVHPEDRASIHDQFVQLQARPGSTFTATFRSHHHDGTWRWIETIFTNLLQEPGIEAVVANYHDVTEYKHMEEVLRERAERLAEADRRKDEFLAMLAHELRNPLAPVLNALRVLRLACGDRQIIEQAQNMMERQIRHMAGLVENLLDMSRITRNMIELHRERLDLAALVRNTAEDYRDTLVRGGLSLMVLVPPRPVWVSGDPTRLTQVLTSLLSNSAKFTDPGGEVHVALSVLADRRQAVLSVRDTGIGIDQDMMPQLFDVFAQADRSLDRTRGGLGLGLALVKGLVQLHGGEVEAHSDGPGQGSEFLVRLPLLGEPALRGESRGQTAPAAEQRRILVVEDNRDAADSLRMLLELLGHEVAVAYSGPEGVQSAREWRPDIVLCDIGLPGMDGFGVAEELRRNPQTAKTRLIAITGYGREEDRRHSHEVGFDYHLIKPVDPEDLLKVLISFQDHVTHQPRAP